MGIGEYFERKRFDFCKMTRAFRLLLKNTTGFDAGVVSFVFPAVAGVCGFFSTKKSKGSQMLYANVHVGLTIFGDLLVALNYLIGAIIPGLPLGFKIYCAIFTALWFISGIICGWAAIRYRSLIRAFHDSDV